ncbi:MAG: sigma-54-dependent transcriptional regulator [Phycisphaerae bacterium]
MSQQARILVIDDEESICFAFKRFFEGRGMAVDVAPTGREGIEAYRRSRADVVFLDVRLGDIDGISVLETLRRDDPRACVIIITAYGTLDTVATALRNKAFDFLPKPIDLDKAGELVTQALASRKAMREEPPAKGRSAPADSDVSGPVIVGSSPAMQEVYKQIGKVAQSGAAVLIRGATGTGKELVARAIHHHSQRRGGPFVAVNCGALPENLVESELFGYARGAFTGADADKPGRFESADGGTLLLDEIGDLPLAAQVKLLRFLDTQVIERLGTVKPIRLDVRILASTNRDLAAAIAAGQFRQDLFYRLAVIQIDLPRLADRAGDILPLARHFLSQCSPAGLAPPISDQAAKILQRYSWPGNVRELSNAMEHAAVVSGGGAIFPSHLPEAVRAPAVAASGLEQALAAYLDAVGTGGNDLYRSAIEPLERALIRRVLDQAGGNLSEAAQRLGLHRNTLRNKLRELGLE